MNRRKMLSGVGRSAVMIGRRGWSQNELKVGRMLRDEEGHESGESFPTGDNGTGNLGTEGQSSGVEDNNGQDFDYSQFWNDEEGKPGDGDSNDDDDGGKELGQQLLSQIEGYRVEDVFTEEALNKMREGDLSGVNAGLQSMQQGVMKQVLGMSAMMMQKFEQSMQRRVESMMSSRLEQSQTSQKDENLLSENFQSFGDPKVKPLIQGVFNQSLKHAKGDRKQALEMTRGMLKMMGQTGVKDLGLQTPSNPDDNLSEGPSRLVEELIGR